MSPGPVPLVQIATSRLWTWSEFASFIGRTSPILLSFLLLLQTLELFRLNKMGKKAAFYDRKGGPTVVESEKKIDTTDPESSCPICSDPIGTENPEGTTETWSELPCGHRFGSHCIKHYLGVVADNRPACPICRQAAYHSCGHPVLPVLCAGTVSKPKKASKKHTVTLSDLSWRYCGYCEKARAQVVKSSRLWRPFRYLAKVLDPRRRRERRRQQQQYPSFVPALWGPGLARLRDPGWEKWWKAQAPQEV
ncbi:hypothetical protein QBC41DRAFT_71282 [Cercophora samala]|uniref:RING-type domain-containing protein n=1 Tax=Cercophora samala TaxID=330535 RepID=A0AA40DHT2_9PEZI|nr:hypothetical protein QBC41DRAFT_71282 [Cercophora samala]